MSARCPTCGRGDETYALPAWTTNALGGALLVAMLTDNFAAAMAGAVCMTVLGWALDRRRAKADKETT